MPPSRVTRPDITVSEGGRPSDSPFAKNGPTLARILAAVPACWGSRSIKILCVQPDSDRPAEVSRLAADFTVEEGVVA